MAPTYEYVDEENGGDAYCHRAPEIDWHAEMRSVLGEASQMNDALYANGGVDPYADMRQVHDIVARLVNVCTFLVDENASLRRGVDALRAQAPELARLTGETVREIRWHTTALDNRLRALEVR